MPVYFFHLRGKHILLEDCEGTDLPDLRAALKQILHARSELAAELDGGEDDLAFEVTASSRRLLLKVPVSMGRKGSSFAAQPQPETHDRLSPKPENQLH